MVICLFAIGLNAQTETKEKSETRVVIIEKTLDDSGNETVKKRVLTGEEAENYREDNTTVEMDGDRVRVEVDTDGTTDEKRKKEVRKRVRIITTEGDEMDEATRKELRDLGVDVDDLTGEEKREVRIVAEEDTVIEGAPLSDGNTLEVSNLNINLNNDELSIEVQTPARKLHARVIDTAGKSIFDAKMEDNSGKFSITADLKDAASGPVFFTITSGDKVFSERIVR